MTAKERKSIFNATHELMLAKRLLRLDKDNQDKVIQMMENVETALVALIRENK